MPPALAVASCRVEESWIVPPTAIESSESVVVIVGLRGATTTFSFAALQAFAVALLLASPP